jgi:hypothetical protein
VTENELKAAAIGIIIYAQIIQTGEPPEIDPETLIVNAGAILDNAVLDTTLGLCNYISIDDLELAEVEPD